MKNKIINTLIIIWAIVITIYIGNSIYNNIMISRTNEIDALNTLYKQNKLKKEPILIGIGDYQNIKDYIEDKKISFQYFSIDKENYQKSFKYDAVPLTLVVNNKGEVLFSKVGWGESETLINSFVKKVNAYN